MKITEYPTAQFFDENDVLIKDGTNGTKQIKASDMVYALFDGIPEMHRQIYRGKNLGPTFTAAQKEAISSGTFHDLWIGDYWVISDNTYLIADFDSYYGMGDTKCMTHHANIVPNTLIGSTFAYSTSDGDPTKLYGNSTFRTTMKNQVSSTINAAFPDSILSYRDFLHVSCDQGAGVTDGSKNWNVSSQWFDCDIELMSVEMIVGNVKPGPIRISSLIPTRTQLPLFSLKPQLAIIDGKNTNYWTRSPSSESPRNYCIEITITGNAMSEPGQSLHYARPFFLIKG